jgi:HEPN domain-containing protein
MLLDSHDPALAGFCLEQAVEKFLKAFLLSKGWILRRVHNLEAFLDDAIVYDPSLEAFRDVCQKITAYYSIERYPYVLDSGITEEDVRTSRQQVTALIDKLRTMVGPQKAGTEE